MRNKKYTFAIFCFLFLVFNCYAQDLDMLVEPLAEDAHPNIVLENSLEISDNSEFVIGTLDDKSNTNQKSKTNKIEKKKIKHISNDIQKTNEKTEKQQVVSNFLGFIYKEQKEINTNSVNKTTNNITFTNNISIK